MCLAEVDTLATLTGNQDIYSEMKEMMNTRLTEHQDYIDETIKHYAEEHLGDVKSLEELPKIKKEFSESIILSEGEIITLGKVLRESGGRIQVMFVESKAELPVFEGKAVWGHAGTYVTVFALYSEKDTEAGIKKIVARIYHEIWARSKRAKDLYNEEIRKTQPKTPEEVKKAANISREKYEKEVNLVVREIEEFGYITSPRFQEIFGNLMFEDKIDFMNRDFTYPGEVDKFLKPDFVMQLPPENFDASYMEYFYYAHEKFISKYG